MDSLLDIEMDVLRKITIPSGRAEVAIYDDFEVAPRVRLAFFVSRRHGLGFRLVEHFFADFVVGISDEMISRFPGIMERLEVFSKVVVDSLERRI